jgi:hypothetical protein
MNQTPRIPFLPFSDRAAKAFGSKRSDPSIPDTPSNEFTDSARLAFHSNRSKGPQEVATPFPSAFGGTARSPRTEFGESAAMAFGGGGARRSDFDDTASSAFGGGGNRSGFSGERESSAFGRKQRRPMERPSLPKAPLTAAEQLVSQAGAPSWSNSALSTAPVTVSDVLKNETVFPTLGSASGKKKPVTTKEVATKAVVAVAIPPSTGLTLAEKTKVWSAQTDQQREREAAHREREALIRAADERQANVFRSYAKHHPADEDEDYSPEDETYYEE